MQADRFAHRIDGIPFDHKFLYGALGYNFKCSEINAAFGNAQLNKLDQFRNHRLALFAQYMDRLKDVPEVQLARSDWKNTLYMAFPIQPTIGWGCSTTSSQTPCRLGSSSPATLPATRRTDTTSMSTTKPTGSCMTPNPSPAPGCTARGHPDFISVNMYMASFRPAI